MRTLLGTEGGSERVILCVAQTFMAVSFYLAVRVLGRYYRLAFGPHIRYWIHLGRS